MKNIKLLLSTFSLVGQVAAFGQITVNSAQVMPIGAIYNLPVTGPLYGDFTTTLFTDQIPTGANQNWVINTLTPAYTHTLSITAANNAPFPDVYGADKAITFDNGSSGTNFFTHNANALSIIGATGSDATPTFYTPSRVITQFPMNFNDSYTGVSVESSKFAMGMDLGGGYIVDSVKRRTTINYEYDIDGWGTLTTPQGTFEVLRQTTFLQAHDTADYLNQTTGQWVPNAEVSFYETKIITFWAENEGYPVMELVDQGYSGMIGSIFWTQNTTTGIVNDNVVREELIFYPNPAHDHIFVNKTGRLFVFDLTGKAVLTHTSAFPYYQLDISTLQVGSYIIVIENEDGKFTRKLVKR